MTKSQLFRAYNKARRAARQAGQDTGRINRALGVALHGRVKRAYQTTVDACDCPDSRYRPGVVCKHRLALQWAEQARQAEKAAERERASQLSNDQAELAAMDRAAFERARSLLRGDDDGGIF